MKNKTEKHTKKLLAISGGPHDDGATAAMLRCAVNAAKEAGWETETICLYEQNIGLCRGCRACIAAGACVYEDDTQQIAALLQECDAVVLAAPTYWANVPGAVKNMFDRLLGTAMGESGMIPRPRLSKNQRYLLLTSCNTPFPFSWLFGQSTGALSAMDEFFRYAGMKRMGRVTFPGAGGKKTLPRRIERRIANYFANR